VALTMLPLDMLVKLIHRREAIIAHSTLVSQHIFMEPVDTVDVSGDSTGVRTQCEVVALRTGDLDQASWQPCHLLA